MIGWLLEMGLNVVDQNIFAHLNALTLGTNVLAFVLINNHLFTEVYTIHWIFIAETIVF